MRSRHAGATPLRQWQFVAHESQSVHNNGSTNKHTARAWRENRRLSRRTVRLGRETCRLDEELMQTWSHSNVKVERVDNVLRTTSPWITRSAPFPPVSRLGARRCGRLVSVPRSTTKSTQDTWYRVGPLTSFSCLYYEVVYRFLI
jgi:hypothetical protein